MRWSSTSTARSPATSRSSVPRTRRCSPSTAGRCPRPSTTGDLAGHTEEAIIATWLDVDGAELEELIGERIRRYVEAAADGSTIEPPVRDAVRYAAARVPVASARARSGPRSSRCSGRRPRLPLHGDRHGRRRACVASPIPRATCTLSRCWERPRARAGGRVRGHRGRHCLGEGRGPQVPRGSRHAPRRPPRPGRRARRPDRSRPGAEPRRLSGRKRDSRDRPGHDRNDLPRRGRGAQDARPRLPRDQPAIPRPGWVEHDPEEIWRACSPRPRRRSRPPVPPPPTSPRSASPTSARRPSSGSGATGGRCTGDRLAGPAHRGSLRARCPADLVRAAHRARP